MNYLRDYEFDLLLPEYRESYIYDEQNTVKVLNCPEFYENEVNTYKAERIVMPNVSTKYNQEREYMLWRYIILGNKSSMMYNF